MGQITQLLSAVGQGRREAIGQLLPPAVDDRTKPAALNAWNRSPAPATRRGSRWPARMQAAQLTAAGLASA